MIAIISFGSGNVRAIGNIYKNLNIPFVFASEPVDLAKAEKIILPGVGAFDPVMDRLGKSGLRQALDEQVLMKKKHVLGICVGMQLMAKSSEEGKLPGLGWIDGSVKKFDHSSFNQETHLPHMGWNNVEPGKSDSIFKDVGLSSRFYFLHSYYFSCNRREDTLSLTDYGGHFASAINYGNIYGVQFHPEKSHGAGIQLLKNFANL